MEKYRPNVAALMINADGNLLICERSNLPGAWQFPQGGVDKGESEVEALFREVKEEIGLKKSHYKILGSRGGYRYLYPEDVRAKKVKKHGNHGQEQTYFLCQLSKGAPQVNVNQDPREFGSYRWILPEEFDLDWLPVFKHEVYTAVMKDFFNLDLQSAMNLEDDDS
ncbi:MAG: NUDIX domain-containing protein [Luteolibacter sp.]